MTGTVIQFPYRPRAAFAPFHSRANRFALLVCHRRAGKTVAVVNDMVARAFRTMKPNAMYAYIAPTYGQAKAVAWAYVKGAIPAEVLPQCKVSESETSIVLPNGAKLRLFGVDKPDNLRGLYFDGVVCDEFGEWEGRAYTEVIRPAIADRRGWAVFIGTPKGPANRFAQLRDSAMKPGGAWFYMALKASESGLLPEEELKALQQDMDADEYAQELECSFQAAIKGSYYGQHVQTLEADGKLCTVEYDTGEPVYAALDIGFADALAIWFWQVIDGEVRFFDYFERTGMDAEECLDMLELKPYRYEVIYLPHDAKARTFRSRKSVVDTFIERSAPARLVPKLDLKDGIDAVRKTLRTYPLRFDAERCVNGLKCLRNYQRKWDKDAGVYSNTATHDQWSHGADAFRYACLVINRDTLRASVERATAKREHVQRTGTAPGADGVNMTRWTFDDAWKTRDEQRAAAVNAGRARL